MVFISFHYRTIKFATVHWLLLICLISFSLSISSDAVAQAVTSSGYSLVGTIKSGDFEGAVIIVAKGEQSFFRLYENLPDGSQIVKVGADRISLKGADGNFYDMYISHERTVGSAAPTLDNVSTPPVTTSTNEEPLVPPQPNRSHRRIRHSSAENE